MNFGSLGLLGRRVVCSAVRVACANSKTKMISSQSNYRSLFTQPPPISLASSILIYIKFNQYFKKRKEEEAAAFICLDDVNNNNIMECVLSQANLTLRISLLHPLADMADGHSKYASNCSLHKQR